MASHSSSQDVRTWGSGRSSVLAYCSHSTLSSSLRSRRAMQGPKVRSPNRVFKHLRIIDPTSRCNPSQNPIISWRATASSSQYATLKKWIKSMRSRFSSTALLKGLKTVDTLSKSHPAARESSHPRFSPMLEKMTHSRTGTELA